MQDYEKLGAFYLGNTHDLASGKTSDDIVLYDSKDLTTHAVIIGMTGSGKTGLGIGLLEEAGIDRIPVIAIDPKGDLGNLLLTFPKLRPEDFRPWVNPREAAEKGMDVDAYARDRAALWTKGLAGSGQGGDRIATLRDTVDMAIYTPGSSAGQSVSVLDSFRAPPPAVMADADAYRERVQATATGILALLGLDADPITSREHILIANILDHSWRDGADLDLGGLIGAIQSPPMDKIGVMTLDAFYPSKDRFALAMKLNNLLAAPGFEAWMQGQPLSADSLLYTASGKPRISVMSIAHLGDDERMFFVTMLLNEILTWMRGQPGTGSLRAILYMDEIFGYMPPTANPPSKRLLLTMLKQARAYGLGLVLATQNPVDLDYKGLSNTGTWFIGRLQTERDKMRVMEGLEGAAAGGEFDKQRMEQVLAGLGKRKFLLHNVHESEPVVFSTRWVMSYLAGPFTRDQISALKGDEPAPAPAHAAQPAPKKPAALAGATAAAPAVPPQVKQFYLEPTRSAGDDETLVYHPLVGGAAEIVYSSAKYKVDEQREVLYAVEIDDGPVPVDWEEAEALEATLDDLGKRGRDDSVYADLPAGGADAKNYRKWETLFKRWIRSDLPLILYRSPALKLASAPGESERDFRIRLQQAGSEKRDIAAGKLRKKYASKTRTLEKRLMRAQQKLEVQGEQAKQKKFDTAIAFGTAILGAFLGRKAVSSSSASRMGSAVKGVGRARKEAGDVERAKEELAAVQADLDALNAQLEQEIEELDSAYDAQSEALDEITIKARSTETTVHFVGLLWAPYYRDSDGRLSSARD